jgi:hypothetical protein
MAARVAQEIALAAAAAEDGHAEQLVAEAVGEWCGTPPYGHGPIPWPRRWPVPWNLQDPDPRPRTVATAGVVAALTLLEFGLAADHTLGGTEHVAAAAD